MGAPCSQARKPGTGSIRVSKGNYIAYRPQSGGPVRKEHRIGTFRTRYEARRALEEWLQQQGK